jgi:hypothetical protein
MVIYSIIATLRYGYNSSILHCCYSCDPEHPKKFTYAGLHVQISGLENKIKLITFIMEAVSSCEMSVKIY